MIVAPKNSCFNVLFDKKAKNSLVVPGLYLEVVVIFQTDIVEDYHDKVEFITEGFKCEVELKAFKPQAIVHFEPIVNFGCIVSNGRKTESVEFVNEGVQDITLEFKLAKETEISISPDKIELGKKGGSKEKQKSRASLNITYEYANFFKLGRKIIKINVH